MNAQQGFRNIHVHFMYVVAEYQTLESSNTNDQSYILFILKAVIMNGMSYTLSSTYKH